MLLRGIYFSDVYDSTVAVTLLNLHYLQKLFTSAALLPAYWLVWLVRLVLHSAVLALAQLH